MSNKLVNDSNERRCEFCGGDTTYIAVTKKGNSYPKWYNNPSKEGTWICGKCIKNLMYHNALPPIHVRRSIRKERIANRVCYKCGGKTNTQNSKTSSHVYHVWHKHPEIPNKWLCSKCYAELLFEPKRKFKTRDERYQYISKLFSGTGNPMYGNHTLNLGRVYTKERNKKVSNAVKEWAKTHREHYYRIGVLGALKARALGLSGIPTDLEIKMEKALRRYKIQYLSQRRYGMGIMDFYLPEGNVALFVDGGVWHADPRLYGPDDVLFFGTKTYRAGWKNVTAKDIWRKDRIHNNCLKWKGYTVIRLWEKEIKCDIDRCIEIIKKELNHLRNNIHNKPN